MKSKLKIASVIILLSGICSGSTFAEPICKSELQSIIAMGNSSDCADVYFGSIDNSEITVLPRKDGSGSDLPLIDSLISTSSIETVRKYYEYYENRLLKKILIITTIEATGDVEYKTQDYSYGDDGNRQVVIEKTGSDKASLQNSCRYTYEFDACGNITMNEECGWSEERSEWIIRKLHRRQYDSNRNVVFDEIQYDSNDRNRTCASYTEFNELNELTQYSWSKDREDWTPIRQYTYQYNDDQMPVRYASSEFDFDRGQLMECEVNEYFYIDQNDDIIEFYVLEYRLDKAADALVSTGRKNYKYNGKGDPEIIIYFSRSVDSDSWIPTQKVVYVYAYNDSGNLTVSGYEIYEANGELWTLRLRDLTKYDDNGNEIELVTSSIDNNVVYGDKTVMTYNADSKLLTKLVSHCVDDEYTPHLLDEYEYSGDYRSMVVNKYFFSESNNWEMYQCDETQCNEYGQLTYTSSTNHECKVWYYYSVHDTDRLPASTTRCRFWIDGLTLNMYEAQYLSIYTIQGFAIYSGVTDKIALPDSGIYFVMPEDSAPFPILIK